MNNFLQVSSIQSLAAVDGPGVRYGIFLQGCNLRCAYCHNPETWDISKGTTYSCEDLLNKALRYKPYFGKSGGVTVSGGEPLLQSKALCNLAELLQENNINLTIDTSGSVINDDVKTLLSYKPLIMLDIKMLNEDKYNKYVKFSFNKVIDFLNLCKNTGCNVWVRYVAVPDINDSLEEIEQLSNIVNTYTCIDTVQILPYHNLGKDKYTNLGIAYPLEGFEPLSEEKLKDLKQHLKINLIKANVL